MQKNVQVVCLDCARSVHGASIYCALAMYNVWTDLSSDSTKVAYMKFELKRTDHTSFVLVRARGVHEVCMECAWGKHLLCSGHV